MHELSLADSIVNTALDVASEHKATSIKRVTVEIGSFALVIKEQLRFCIEILAENTIAAKAEFELLTIPGVLHCAECNFEGPVKDVEDSTFGQALFLCPNCESLGTRILSGRDVVVRSVDLSI